MARWIVGAGILTAVVAVGMMIGVGLSEEEEETSTTTQVRIAAERQESGDVHLGLNSADGRVLSPGEDNIFRAGSMRATSRPIGIEVVRPLEMDSERYVSGVGERAETITLSPGLWLCSTTFNTIMASRFSEADFELILGDEQYSDPTVGHDLYGSGTVYLVHAGEGFSSWLDPVPANVEVPVTPIEARAEHRWSLYCNRVSHK